MKNLGIIRTKKSAVRIWNYIDNQEIADAVLDRFTIGRSLSYYHITMFKAPVWDKGLTVVNENVNVPMKSLKAIVMLFIHSTITDSEEFVYPNISEVKLTIDGVPNVLYSQGMKVNRFYDEAKRFFSDGDNRDQFMTVEKYYKDKFAFGRHITLHLIPKTQLDIHRY